MANTKIEDRPRYIFLEDGDIIQERDEYYSIETGKYITTLYPGSTCHNSDNYRRQVNIQEQPHQPSGFSWEQDYTPVRHR